MRPVDPDLQSIVISMVATVKSEFPYWADPERLSSWLGVKVLFSKQNLPVQGATVNDVVVVDGSARSRGRQVFTFYHEILHQLIRRHEELYSVLHDRYDDEESFQAAVERLADIGAAEFMLPRQAILDASLQYGYTLELLPHFLGSIRVSPTAVCVQLALCAPHRCIGVVARPSGGIQSRHLITEVAVSSDAMRYRVARNVPIAPGHLLHRVMLADEGMITAGRTRIPFRTATTWEVDCEAVRIRGQVFALFHVDPPRGPLQPAAWNG